MRSESQSSFSDSNVDEQLPMKRRRTTTRSSSSSSQNSCHNFLAANFRMLRKHSKKGDKDDVKEQKIDLQQEVLKWEETMNARVLLIENQLSEFAAKCRQIAEDCVDNKVTFEYNKLANLDLKVEKKIHDLEAEIDEKFLRVDSFNNVFKMLGKQLSKINDEMSEKMTAEDFAKLVEPLVNDEKFLTVESFNKVFKVLSNTCTKLSDEMGEKMTAEDFARLIKPLAQDAVSDVRGRLERAEAKLHGGDASRREINSRVDELEQKLVVKMNGCFEKLQYANSILAESTYDKLREEVIPALVDKSVHVKMRKAKGQG